MFLNYSTGRNQIVGKINNTMIMSYGHVTDRYQERLGRVYEITNEEMLKYDNLLKCAICSRRADDKVGVGGNSLYGSRYGNIPSDVL